MNPHQFRSRFNDKSTASEVIEGFDLSGSLAVVTGGAAGIGKETARALGSAGADVIIGARNRNVLNEAVRELRSLSRGQVFGYELDLLSLHEVERFAEQVLALKRGVDLLILNAAVMACPLSRNAQGIECHLATNFIGHALLTSRLVPALLTSPTARVISLSSTAHQMSPVEFDDINYQHRAYDPWEAYAQSKTASALLAVKVSHTLGPQGVTAHTLHPGGIHTGLLKHVHWDLGVQLAERYNYDVSNSKVKTVSQGAATTVWAATEPTLLHHEVAYLEDCQISPVLEKPVYSHGVMRYALDLDNAARLWSEAERLAGIGMALDPV